MTEGLKRAVANARRTHVAPGMGTWLEEYKCGCTSVTKSSTQALGYCPTHGADRISLLRLHEAVSVGLSK